MLRLDGLARNLGANPLRPGAWFRVVREFGRIPWPHDCLRHSFVSYALPIWGPTQVAQWSGHSEAILVAHYRELVPKHEAERFWRLLAKPVDVSRAQS